MLVDVAGMRVETKSRLTVFPAAVRSHPGPATVLLFGASGELTGLMGGGVLGEVRAFTTSQQARTAVAVARSTVPRRAVLRLPPTPTAAARARALVAEACRTWHIDHLRAAATLVISELVSNAVEHAGTDLQVDVALRRDRLHLSVRDHDPRLPVATGPDPDHAHPAVRGRGLHLVDAYATAWGSHVTGDGKTVWVALQATA